MLALFAGRERTEHQWLTLLLDAGFEPVRFGRGGYRGARSLTVGKGRAPDHGRTWP